MKEQDEQTGHWWLSSIVVVILPSHTGTYPFIPLFLQIETHSL